MVAVSDTNACCTEAVTIHGPPYGVYLEQVRSWYVYKGKDEAVAYAAYENLGLQINF